MLVGKGTQNAGRPARSSENKGIVAVIYESPEGGIA